MSDIRRNPGRIFRSREGNLTEFPLPRGWIGGFGLANGSDADHDINIAAGEARDSTNAFNIEQTATDPFVKQLDQPWAAGTAAGGLGTPQIDGAQTITFNDNGGSNDDITIDSGTWAVTPEAGDTLIINGSSGGTNDLTVQVISSSTTICQVATATFADESNSAATAHLIVDNDTYHVFAIRADDSPGSAVDFGFDTSVTATNLLSESSYSYYRRIGSRRTDGTSNWILFLQQHDLVLLGVSVHDVAAGTPGTGILTHTLTSVPTGLQLEALVSIIIVINATGFTVVGHGDISTLATPTSSDKDMESLVSEAERPSWNGPILTNTSAQIKTRSNPGPTTVDIQVKGWIDRRGKGD